MQPTSSPLRTSSYGILHNNGGVVLMRFESSATIVLHDPHADVHKPDCVSSLAILQSARLILDSVRQLDEANHDCSALAHNTAVC